MTGSVVLVADAGREAGLGHIARSSAVTVALRSRGVAMRCYASGAREPFGFDGVEWAPLRSDELPDVHGHVLVIDSYRLSQETVAAAGRSNRLVVMHDHGDVPPEAALVISAVGVAGDGAVGLSGLAYAALRPGYWGLPARKLEGDVRTILVTTGGGLFADVGADVARGLAQALPQAKVRLVRGPHATIVAPPGVDLLDAPGSLLEPLLAADLVVSGAGQTMLEAAAAGTPCVALLLAENQRRQAAALDDLGAIRLVDPPQPEGATGACLELVADPNVRSRMSAAGQTAVDGYGALRVAFRIAELANGDLA